ncbi:MAG: N-acetylmuramoyl-L-alanine amidase [Victivallales bacterium]|nr:N-acetylmuramoyl-L-alanine amidase [Victivallales bacterium]
MTAYCILFVALGIALFCSGCATFAMRGHRCNGVPMRVMLLDRNAYNLRRKLPGPMPELKYITIHNTANRVSAVEERNYLNNRRDNVSVSFHYAVDEKEVVQLIPDDQHAWHAGDGTGDGNMKSISIEICRSLCRDKENHLYLRSEENAVRFTAWLLKKHGLGVDCLRMHKDWSGKNCPHRILEADSWDDFKKRVAAAM